MSALLVFNHLHCQHIDKDEKRHSEECRAARKLDPGCERVGYCALSLGQKKDGRLIKIHSTPNVCFLHEIPFGIDEALLQRIRQAVQAINADHSTLGIRGRYTIIRNALTAQGVEVRY